MEFSIPNTGYLRGTCGWLAKGLADGSVKIHPGTTKSGKGGLWLHCEGQQGCLAIFNEYDLSAMDMPGHDKFRVVAEDFCGSFPLTDTCEKYLRQLASDWCDAANELRESDGVMDLPEVSIQ